MELLAPPAHRAITSQIVNVILRQALTLEDRKLVGRDIQKVEFGWPVGMPYCRNPGNGLWEVRSDLTDVKIGRVIFCVARERMVLLHGFVKKTQKTPAQDLRPALQRMKEVL